MALPSDIKFAAFVNGAPVLASLADLIDAVGTAELRRILDEAEQRGVDRLSAVAQAVSTTNDELRAGVAFASDRIAPIEADVSALNEATVGYEESFAALLLADIDQEAARRQAIRDTAAIGDTLLRLLSEAGRTRDVLRDAGIVVDPATGVVRIYAVDQIAERTSRTEVTLDAQRALITTKAGVDYVDQQILLAQLDPSTAAELGPLFARVMQAESDIDGLNAAVALKASALELAGLTGQLTTVSQTLDALANTVTTKADQTTVDQYGTRIAAAEALLGNYGGVTGFSVSIRQARFVADGAAEVGLRGLVAEDDANRRQIDRAAEARQEVFTRLTDGLAAEATARTLLAVQLGAADARAVEQITALADADKVQAQRIDALGVTSLDQAAAIGTLQEASIAQGVGIASTTTTIRQQAGRADTSGEALLRALIAGDQVSQERGLQLVQIQTEFATTLVANEAASAIARQALLARMGAAEAAIVSTSKVLADTTQALTQRLDAAEAVVNDPGTGLAATRVRLSTEENLRATGDQANADAVNYLAAEVHHPDDGLPATRAKVASLAQTVAQGDQANAQAVQEVSASLTQEGQDRAAGDDANAAAINGVAADVTAEQQARVAGDAANALSLQQVSATVGEHSASLTQLFEAVVTPDGAGVKAVLALSANGRVSGIVQTNDGTLSNFGVSADVFEVVDPDTGAVLFRVDGDGAIVAKLKAGSIDTPQLASGSVMKTAFFFTAADIVVPYSG